MVPGLLPDDILKFEVVGSSILPQSVLHQWFTRGYFRRRQMFFGHPLVSEHATRRKKTGVRRYIVSWLEMEIVSVDFISTMANSAPFLIAVTAEWLVLNQSLEFRKNPARRAWRSSSRSRGLLTVSARSELRRSPKRPRRRFTRTRRLPSDIPNCCARSS